MTKKIFYSSDQEMVDNLIKPVMIKEFEKKTTIDCLSDLISKNFDKVNIFFFDKKNDEMKLKNFIEVLEKKIDEKNTQQAKLYNELYQIFDFYINAPKTSDNSWVTYEEACKNCKSMHLLAYFCEAIEINTFLIGENLDN